MATPVAEALLLIAAIIATAIVASIVIYSASMLSSRIETHAQRTSEILNTIVVLLGIVYNESSGCYSAYLKNVGTTPICNLENSSILFGNTTYIVYLTYSPSPVAGCTCWGYVELGNVNKLWDPEEVVKLILCPPVTIDPPYKLILVLPNGFKLKAVSG